MTTFDLTGKTCLVTGGNSGIGLAIADGLAAAGADVAIWGRDAVRTADAAEHLRRHGTRIAGLTCDVSDEDAVGETFSATLDALGHLDACFANAGVAGIAPSTAEMDTDEWRRVISANLDGSFFTLRAAAAHLVERGTGGSLVATSSRRAAVGQPRAPHYSASKGGLESMVRALAVELGPHGIRANIISPGWIDTPMSAPVITKPRVTDAVLPRIPIGRWGTGADFAGIAVYLASDASRYHTGDTFVIDGGYGLV